MSPSPTEKRTLGRTGLEVTALCLGTSPFSMPELYGHAVARETAVSTVLAALDAGIGFIDTSNGYGEGESERIVGDALALRPNSSALVATKVDPDPRSGDFSASRAIESFEESLERLGLERVSLLYLHDPERIGAEATLDRTGPLAGMVALRDRGLVDHLGIAGGPNTLNRRLLATDEFDVLLSHSRYSLLDRSALGLFDEAHRRGIGVVNAAPFGGGILAKGPTRARYGYHDAPPAVVASATRMAEACARAGVPLAAAALQFSLRCPLIDATVVGMTKPERVAQTLVETTISAELWSELDDAAPDREHWLG